MKRLFALEPLHPEQSPPSPLPYESTGGGNRQQTLRALKPACTVLMGKTDCSGFQDIFFLGFLTYSGEAQPHATSQERGAG